MIGMNAANVGEIDKTARDMAAASESEAEFATQVAKSGMTRNG